MTEPASWIWSDLADPRPANRFTWFRRVVHLDDVPDRPVLALAADSTASLWVNGEVVRRKVTRYHEPLIRADSVDVRRQLRPGPNVLVVLHHSWGEILTFQRTGLRHAGLWIDSDWLVTDATWRWRHAAEFGRTEQFLGVHDHTPRIRYPVDWDTRMTPADLHLAAFDDDADDDPDEDADDDDGWRPAAVVQDGPWPSAPELTETPGQRESDQLPGRVLNAGTTTYRASSRPDGPTSRPSLLARAEPVPDPDLVRAAHSLVSGAPVVIPLYPGQTRYVTMDLFRPVHGYPFVDVSVDSVDSGDGEVELRLGYGELVTSSYDGSTHLTEDGWVDVDGVVATGYADRMALGPGRGRYEMPDERTARWLTIHLTATQTARVTLRRVGIVKSQYPIAAVGSFACGDEQIEQIIKLCRVHAEVTMSDTYVDTPGREDGQWIEDARPRAVVSERWFDDTRLRRLMIRTLAEGQTADGELHPFFPSNFPVGPASYDWSVQWVGMLWDDYRWHADVEFVRGHYAILARYWDVALSHVDADGRWRTARVLADIRTSRPPSADGSSGVITPWIIDRLRDSAELATAVGDDRRAAAWSAMADRMTDGFRRHHLVRDHPDVCVAVADRWGPNLPTSERGFSQAGQAVALVDGLLTTEEADAVIAWAFPAPDGTPPPGVARWNNPTWAYRVLRALSRHGHAGRAVAHLKERYAPYLPGHPANRTPINLQGPYGGPLPEYWLSREDLGLAAGEVNRAQPVDLTGSHGWGAVPLLWLHDSLLGVEIATPGGAALTIRPSTGGLPYVSGWTQTPRGPVHVHLDPQQPLLRISLPATAAMVTVPDELGPDWVVDHAGTMTDRDARRVTLDGPGTFTIGPRAATVAER